MQAQGPEFQPECPGKSQMCGLQSQHFRNKGRIPGAPWTASLTVSELWVQWEALSRKIRRGPPEEDMEHQPLISICVHTIYTTFKHMCLHARVYTYTRAYTHRCIVTLQTQQSRKLFYHFGGPKPRTKVSMLPLKALGSVLPCLLWVLVHSLVAMACDITLASASMSI